MIECNYILLLVFFFIVQWFYRLRRLPANCARSNAFLEVLYDTFTDICWDHGNKPLIFILIEGCLCVCSRTILISQITIKTATRCQIAWPSRPFLDTTKNDNLLYMLKPKIFIFIYNSEQSIRKHASVMVVVNSDSSLLIIFQNYGQSLLLSRTLNTPSLIFDAAELLVTCGFALP